MAVAAVGTPSSRGPRSPVTLRVRCPTCSRVLVSSPAGGAAAAASPAARFPSSASGARGFSELPPAAPLRSSRRRSGDRSRPREGEEVEPLEREASLLLLEVVEDDEPLEREDSLLLLERAIAAALSKPKSLHQEGFDPQ